MTFYGVSGVAASGVLDSLNGLTGAVTLEIDPASPAFLSISSSGTTIKLNDSGVVGLAPGTIQTGAYPQVQLADSKSLLVQNTTGVNILSITGSSTAGNYTTLFNVGDDSTLNFAVGEGTNAGHVMMSFSGLSQTLYLGGPSTAASFYVVYGGNPTINQKSLVWYAPTSGTLTLTPAATTTSYSLTWPAAQGYVALVNNGAGVLSWSGTAQTTLSGTTAGTAVSSMPFQGATYKKFIVYFSGYENDTATNQTITLPTAFTNTPVLTASVPGLTVTASTTTITIVAPNSTTTFTGWVIVEGD